MQIGYVVRLVNVDETYIEVVDIHEKKEEKILILDQMVIFIRMVEVIGDVYLYVFQEKDRVSN